MAACAGTCNLNHPGEVTVDVIANKKSVPVCKAIGPVIPERGIWDNFLDDAKGVVAKWRGSGTTLAGLDRQRAGEDLNRLTSEWLPIAQTDLEHSLILPAGSCDGIGERPTFTSVTLSKALHRNNGSGTPSRVCSWVANQAQEVCTLLRRRGRTGRLKQDDTAKLTGIAQKLAETTVNGSYGDALCDSHMTGDLKNRFKGKVARLGVLLQGAIAWPSVSIGPGLDLATAAVGIFDVSAQQFRSLAQELVTIEWRRTPNGWEEWAKAAVQHGASLGHSWTKVAVGWHAEWGVDSAGQPSCVKTDVVRLHRDKLAKAVSEVTLKATSPLQECKVPLLPEISGDEVRAAGRSFKAKTSNPTGLHPKHFGLISRNAATGFAHILNLVELVGDFAADGQLVGAGLIRKPDGKRRQIGIYNSDFRIYGKVRRQCLRNWERGLKCANFNVAAGRSTTDAVWRRAARAEAGVAKGQAAVATFSDLQSFYEFVSWDILAANAARVGYPLAVLRVTVASYTWPRYVACDRLLGVWILPSRGVVAGSFAATYEVKAYLLPSVLAVADRHPSTPISIHIDDIVTEGVGKAMQIGREVAECQRDLNRTFEDNLGLHFAKHKGATVGSHADTTAYIAKALGGYTAAKLTTADLGAEFGGGVKYSRRGKGRGGIRRARIVNGRLRFNRYRRLRKAAGDNGAANKVFFAGIRPAMCYAADVTGVAPRTADRLSTLAMKAIGLSGPGQNRSITLAALPAIDVGSQTAAAVVFRYAAEWWMTTDKDLRHNDCLSPGELVRAFVGAMKMYNGRKQKWGDVAGPISAALFWIVRAGWTVVNANTFTDRKGVKLVTTLNCPSQFRKHLIRDLIEGCADEAAANFAGIELTAEGRAIQRQGYWAEPMQRMQRSTKFGPRQKATALRFANGGIVTNAVLRDWGYATDGLCKYCGLPDTAWHRVYQCYHGTECRDGADCAGIVAEALEAGPGHPLFGRLALAEPTLLPDADWSLKTANYLIDGEPTVPFLFDVAEGPLYPDGSAFNASCAILARAGWAVAQVNNAGSVKVAYGAVPRFYEQQASTGEHVATFHCSLPASGPADIRPDCCGVISSWQRGPTYARGIQRPQAGPWRDMQVARGTDIFECQVTHTKAHRTVGTEMSVAEVNDVRGNAIADEFAKKGAMLTAPEKADSTRIGKLLSKWKAVCNLTVAVLGAWDDTAKELPKFGREPKGGLAHLPAVGPETPHKFSANPSGWTCTECFVNKSVKASSLDAQNCCGAFGKHAGLLESPNGHAFRLFEYADRLGGVIICTKCLATVDARTSGKVRAPCNGSRFRGYLVRFNAGIHPLYGDRKLGKSWTYMPTGPESSLATAPTVTSPTCPTADTAEALGTGCAGLDDPDGDCWEAEL